MLVLYSKVCIEYLTMKPIIIIQPILFQLTGDLTSLLEQHISKEFDALVKITSPLNDNQLPLNLFGNGNQTIYYCGFEIEINLIEAINYWQYSTSTLIRMA
jgi:hypothetical protein